MAWESEEPEEEGEAEGEEEAAGTLEAEPGKVAKRETSAARSAFARSRMSWGMC